MNSEQLSTLSAGALDQPEAQAYDKLFKLQAKVLLDKEIAHRPAADKILELTDEEERLLRAFRRFQLTLKKSSGMFKWQTTSVNKEDIVLVGEKEEVLITDPQDKSS
jgi:hypothetical protein